MEFNAAGNTSASGHALFGHSWPACVVYFLVIKGMADTSRLAGDYLLRAMVAKSPGWSLIAVLKGQNLSFG